MINIDFGFIDTLVNPQRIKTATYENGYVEFVKDDMNKDALKITARLECLINILEWMEDEEIIRNYHFQCEKDDNCTVYGAYDGSVDSDFIVLLYAGDDRVVKREFLSLDNLRLLIRIIKEKTA